MVGSNDSCPFWGLGPGLFLGSFAVSFKGRVVDIKNPSGLAKVYYNGGWRNNFRQKILI